MFSKTAVDAPNPCRTSIVGALSLRIALLATVLIGVLSICVYLATAAMQLQTQERLLTLHVSKLSEMSKSLSRTDEDCFLGLLKSDAGTRPGTHLEILRNDGRRFYRDPEGELNRVSSDRRERSFALASPDGAHLLRGTLSLDVAHDAALLDDFSCVMFLATLVGGALAGGLACLAVRHGLRPLCQLGEQTQKMALEAVPGHLEMTPQVRELYPLVAQFNQLMDNLGASHAQMESFNADVAHELRTPLTSLIGKTELALSRPRSVDELTNTLVSNLESLQRIGALVNDMLFLARADGGDTARLGEPTSLRVLILDMLDYHEPAASDRSVHLAIKGDLVIAVDKPLFLRALSNLLSNATRYAVPGSTVTVTLDVQAGVPCVGVSNQGPIIQPEHLPRLFDRLYRVDASRSHNDGMHCGLGLSIVAAIARMHRWKTWARSDAYSTSIGFWLSSVHAR